jgi:hypothetical protein
MYAHGWTAWDTVLRDFGRTKHMRERVASKYYNSRHIKKHVCTDTFFNKFLKNVSVWTHFLTNVKKHVCTDTFFNIFLKSMSVRTCF